jgi:cystathionine gamma-lyase
MRGYGGMITIYLKGDIENTKKFLKEIKIFTLAESLGGVESLISVPSIMTH